MPYKEISFQSNSIILYRVVRINNSMLGILVINLGSPHFIY